MTKKLNTASITNELAGSAFFRQNTQVEKPEKTLSTPLPAKPVQQVRQEQVAQQKDSQYPVPEPVPVGVRVSVPPSVPLIPKVKRLIRQRQPFDIYEDQYQWLKKIADEEKAFENGRGMSQMVRIAIDNYLKDYGAPQE
jgi:hypothetical protein